MLPVLMQHIPVCSIGQYNNLMIISELKSVNSKTRLSYSQIDSDISEALREHACWVPQSSYGLANTLEVKIILSQQLLIPKG